MPTTLHTLTPDSQVILLLCGDFGERADETRPLSVAEYRKLAQWLHRQGLRPADLLSETVERALREAVGELPFTDRADRLLKRGGALALTVEQWANQGIWTITRGDAAYPKRIKEKLGWNSPPVLHGVGNQSLLSRGGIAVVGSRDADEEAAAFCQTLAAACARERIPIVSGGARGIDQTAMLGALDAGGDAVGVLAERLGKESLSGKYRAALNEGRLALISPYHPEIGFHVSRAMERNKYIYVLSDAAVVVSSSHEKGGTWSGATENLKHRWVPMAVRNGDAMPEGNRALIQLGGKALAAAVVADRQGFLDWLDGLSKTETPPVVHQASLFSTEAASAAQPTAPSPIEDTVQEAVEKPVLSVPETVAPPETSNPANRLWEQVFPVIRDTLGDPLTEAEFAATLGIEKGQAKAWLKRALHDQSIKKFGKPIRYMKA